jgi:thiamine-phosphate pyrophosphorylase
MNEPIAALHYLTQDLPGFSHEQQVLMACEEGVKWVQLRVKNKPPDEWKRMAEKVKKITDAWGASLLINDSVEIAKLINAEGVHLGQQDESPVIAREKLGPEKIIGFSVHSVKELTEAINFPVDYFGVGPFRYTTTKKNLDAVLGIHGISAMVQAAKTMNVSKPMIAIGGIQVNDVWEMVHCGVNGIAVSSAINLAGNPKKMISRFIEQLQTSNLKIQAQP